MLKVAGVSGIGLCLGLGVACSATGASDCPVGADGCACTSGGACDVGLECLDDVCIPVDHGTESNGSVTASGPDGGSNTSPVTSGPTDGGSTGIKLDVMEDTDTPPQSGCRAIDVLFVLDGSGSMADERGELAATNAFTQVVMTLEGLNGGGIEYRIGVTDDNDSGFLLPAGWLEPDPWFDSNALDLAQMAQAFNGAVAALGGLGGATLGCEHVLTSGTNLLASDGSGFLRGDALLVLVLLTDVDDYGAYDQATGNPCGIGCQTPPPALADLMTTLVGLKNDQMDGVAAIAIAGDPTVMGLVGVCQAPGSCNCDPFLGCEAHHATRLYEFTSMLGTNGFATDICTANVPTAVETALTDNIDLACMNFDPEG